MSLSSSRSILCPLAIACAGALITAGSALAQPYHHGGYHDYNDPHMHGAWREHSHVVVNFNARPYYYAPRPHYYRPVVVFAEPYPAYYANYTYIEPALVTPQAYQAFETTPPGVPVTINGPQSRTTLTPGEVYEEGEGRYCREYTAKVRVGGQLQDSYGQACRQPDGSWQIIS